VDFRRFTPATALVAALVLASCSRDADSPAGPAEGPDLNAKRAPGIAALAAESIEPVKSCTVPGVPAESELNISTRVYYTPDGQKQKLYVAWPKGAGPNPLVVILHGGGWVSGSRTGFRDEARLLAGLGYTAASLDYRLASNAANVFPAAVEDVRCAVRYLRQNAADFKIDPTRVAAIGESAGGHLAAMLGVASDVAGLDGSCPFTGQSPAVNAVVSYYGPTDLRDPEDLPNLQTQVTKFLGNPPQDDPAEAALASPVTHVDASDPRFLFNHRTLDDVVPLQQSIDMKLALDGVGVASTLVQVGGTGHGFPMFSSRRKYRTSSCTALAFLAQELAL
jgi:acetyl esterase/lipase